MICWHSTPGRMLHITSTRGPLKARELAAFVSCQVFSQSILSPLGYSFQQIYSIFHGSSEVGIGWEGGFFSCQVSWGSCIVSAMYRSKIQHYHQLPGTVNKHCRTDAVCLEKLCSSHASMVMCNQWFNTLGLWIQLTRRSGWIFDLRYKMWV